MDCGAAGAALTQTSDLRRLRGFYSDGAQEILSDLWVTEDQESKTPEEESEMSFIMLVWNSVKFSVGVKHTFCLSCSWSYFSDVQFLIRNKK